MTVDGKSTVRSISKAFAVLHSFDKDHVELTLSEVAARAGLDRGTAFRFVHTLVDLGYLGEVLATKRFRLTVKCLELGFTALSGKDLPTHARPLIREAVPAHGDACSLGILDQGEIIYVERAQIAAERLGLDRRPGSKTGAYAAALGHAILAYLPQDEQIRQLECIKRVKVAEQTLTAMPELLGRLKDVREKGYAFADGENAYGLRTIAAPILDAEARPLAGISLTIQASRMDAKSFLAKGLPQVQRLAKELGDYVRLSFGAISVTGGL